MTAISPEHASKEAPKEKQKPKTYTIRQGTHLYEFGSGDIHTVAHGELLCTQLPLKPTFTKNADGRVIVDIAVQVTRNDASSPLDEGIVGTMHLRYQAKSGRGFFRDKNKEGEYHLGYVDGKEVPVRQLPLQELNTKK